MVRKIHLHVISAESVMLDLGVASKMSGELEFLEYLKSIGRRSARQWLTENFDLIGRNSSVNLGSMTSRPG